MYKHTNTHEKEEETAVVRIFLLDFIEVHIFTSIEDVETKRWSTLARHSNHKLLGHV